jgi:hypothetical protein
MKTKKFKLAVMLVACAGTAVAASNTTTIIGTWSGECVSYVRSRLPSLPWGLYSFDDKKRIINSYSCSPGSAAVIDVGNSIGHLSYITSCDASGDMQGLKMEEANWYAGKIDERKCRDSKISSCIKLYRIVGFYRP